MLKLNASYSKKVPAGEEYSSQSFHASVEVELPDGLTQDQLQARIHETFDLVRNSVEAELHGNHIARERLEGYKKALMDNKLPVESCYISHMLSEFYFEPISKINLFYLGYKPALNLLRQKKRPSAIFLAIDELAGGVYHAAEELGIAIPDELSVVGLNNLELCEKFHPALSSIAQPFEEMGRRAVELLLNRLQGTAPVPFVHERLTASLVVRQSSVIYQPSFAPSGATLHR